MRLVRFKKTSLAVLGVLKDDVGGTYFTAENAKTLIPDGAYDVQVCYSPKFKRDLPLLHNDEVLASRGIRFHVGNNPVTESSGCILVGNTSSLVGNKVGKSAEAMAQLLRGIKGAAKLEIESIV